MLGSIIPEPFATQVIVAAPTRVEIALGCVSVVMMPSAPAIGSGPSAAAMPSRPRSMMSMGSCTPITPVELTSTRSAVVPTSAAAAAAIRRAFSSPRAPVATLLHLLFATIARRRPPLIVSRPSVMGAPGKRFRVNTAAAAASASLTKIARSFAVGLRPQLTLAQRNPRGSTGGASNSITSSLVRGRDEAERLLEGLDEQVRIIVAERHRGPDLHDVVVRPVGAEQDAALAHPVGDERGLLTRRLQGLAVLHELHAEEEAGAADVPDERVTVGERPQPRQQARSHAQRMLLELLVAQHVEHGQADRARHGVPAEGAEVLHAVVECGGDLRCRHDGADRVAIAER